MLGRRRRTALIGASLGLLLVAATAIPALGAPRDRTAPTTPTNFRVTAIGSYSISFAWDASTDKSGIASYTICCTSSSSMTVPGTQTTAVFTNGVEANRTYTFRVFARDTAGNASKYSNAVTVTTLPDTSPPGKPTVTATDIGPTHISLAWSSVEEGPVWYTVKVDGITRFQSTRNTSGTVGPLEPSTTYTITVQARDFSGQSSPDSDPLLVTTDDVDETDVMPPSMPPNFWATYWAGDGETGLDWSDSVDNQTPSSVLIYEIYINGVLDHSLLGWTNTVVYGTPQSQNTYSIIAVDASGNRSAPATIVIDNF